MGIVRNLIKQKDDKKNNGTLYSSYKNMILYGTCGKSSVIGALSTKVKKPVLMLSPSGGSELVAQEYPNVISYPVDNMAEINKIYKDLIADFKLIRDLQQVIISDDKDRLNKAKDHYGNEWEEVYSMAKNNEFPISAIALEECNITSNWIQTALESKLEMDYIGEDKGNLGIDWSKLGREFNDFYSKLLRLPITTILATGQIEPKEKQKLTQMTPDICQGSASRKIRDDVGNVFYCYKTDDSKYKIRLNGNKDVYCKDKLLPVRTDKKLEDELDLTGNPEYFWEYLDSLTEDRKILKTKQGDNKKEETKKTKGGNK